MQLPRTIDEVVNHLDLIIESAWQNASALGLFAALYQKVTIKVREGIAIGRFEDGPRMEQLDVVFANRYIQAYHNFENGDPITKSWKITFEAVQRRELILLQHLMLGMNAHINLDLGIAAAEISQGKHIHTLKNDFDEINRLLFELVDEIQDNLSGVSPLLGNLDFLIKQRDEQFARFSMKAARRHAWVVAQRMAFVDVAQRVKAIQSTDDYVVELGNMVLRPAWIPRIGIWLVGLLESKDIRKGIEALRYLKV